MNLKAGSSNWEEEYRPNINYPPLQKDVFCDVLVIGGGCTGALQAHTLVQQNIDTILIDKNAIGSGSTSANTGLLQFMSDKSLISCIHSFGEKIATDFYHLCLHAINELEKISSNLSTAVDFIRKDSLYYASCTEDVPQLLSEYKTLKKYNFPVTLLRQDEIEQLYSFSKPCAIYSSGDAEINPYKLVYCLIKDLHLKGLKVYEHTEVIHHEHGKDNIVFQTKDGYKITAKKAVFATGYEAQKMKRNRNVSLGSTYTIATNEVTSFPGWHNRSLIWETARPYLYIRTTSDNRIICGGLDEETVQPRERDAKLPYKKKALLKEIQKLFPEIPNLSASYAWTGIFGSTHDGLPLIGVQQGYPNCYFSLGYGGNGTVYSMIAANIITSLITTGFHPHAHIFSFDR